MTNATDLPIAKKIRTQADIVFCIDATGSMGPCIDAIKKGLQGFADGLQSAATVDYRLRLIAYRDLHDKTSTVPWDDFDFTDDIDVFKSWLDKVRTDGDTQTSRSGESTLDAMYRGIHSKWRTTKTHRTILVLTDDNTHETLHELTYQGPDANVYRVIQDLREMAHAILFLVAPEFPTYVKIEEALRDAGVDCIASLLPLDERYVGLRDVNWESLLKMIGETVSSSSTEI